MTKNLDQLRAEVVEHGVLDYDQAQELLDRVETAERRLSAAVERKEICSLKLQDAEAAIQRVRDAIKDAPTSDPTIWRSGPPDDWPDDGELIGQGEFLVAEQVRRALDGGEQQ